MSGFFPLGYVFLVLASFSTQGQPLQIRNVDAVAALLLKKHFCNMFRVRLELRTAICSSKI